MHTPFLLVTQPDNPGVIWKRGSSQTISWNSCGDIAGNKVTVEIWKGGKLYKTVASQVVNTGSYSFTIPAGYPVANNYRIKIKSVLSSDYYDFSNSDFTIQ
jgi:hypothetical protein